MRGVRLASTLVLTVSRRLVGQPEWWNGRAHRETLLFQASCLGELVVYRFGFTYLVGYYVNRTQCSYCPNKTLRRLKYTRNFFVCNADKSQRIERDHADEVIAMDLWSAHFVPRQYWLCFTACYR